MVADCAHQHDLLEVGNMDHLHVCAAMLRAAGARGGERVDLVLHNLLIVDIVDHGLCGHLGVHLSSMILRADLGRRRLDLARGVSKAERCVLLGSTGVLVADILSRLVLGRGLDGGISSGVIQRDGEGQS